MNQAIYQKALEVFAIMGDVPHRLTVQHSDAAHSVTSVEMLPTGSVQCKTSAIVGGRRVFVTIDWFVNVQTYREYVEGLQ